MRGLPDLASRLRGSGSKHQPAKEEEADCPCAGIESLLGVAMAKDRVGTSRTYNRGFFMRLSFMLGAVLLAAYALLPDDPQTHVPLELTALPATVVEGSGAAD